MTIDFDKLKAEFPREAVSWRSQTLTAKGDKALALAYINARDVMDRLDEVCGPANWKDEYEIHGAKTLCKISIRIDNEWVWKTDGAGDTQVEAEKGSLSDALKRAAVKWGIGRYLYDLPAIWVECESNERNGKHYFKKWKADPWSKINQPPPPKKTEKQTHAENLYREMKAITTKQGLQSFWDEYGADIETFEPDVQTHFTNLNNEKQTALEAA
jgi:hypothetical protein